MTTHPPTTPGTPPTEPGSVPVEPARWPTAVGTVAIVFACLGALSGCSTVFSGFFMSAFMGALPADAPAQHAFDAMRAWAPWQAALGLAKFAVAIALLVGGILLVQRKPGAGALLIVWAAARIGVAMVDGGVTFFMQRDVMASAAASGAAPTTVMPAFAQMAAAFGAVFALAWGCALPLFMIIWLTLPFARAETARWRTPGR